MTDATQVLRLQRNNSVNAGYSCQDQQALFSLNRHTNANDANPRTKLNITLRELGSTYTNFAFQGNGVIQMPNTGSAGIQFGAYGDGATVISNTLDDYEEGTWTPTGPVTPGYTFSYFEGHYTKIGRQVSIITRIRFSAVGNTGSGTGQCIIQGLPFANIAVLTPGIGRENTNNGAIFGSLVLTGGSNTSMVVNPYEGISTSSQEPFGVNVDYAFSNTYYTT